MTGQTEAAVQFIEYSLWVLAELCKHDQAMEPQIGDIACHTGRQSCFYRVFEDGQWTVVDPVLKDPDAIYHTGHVHE